MRFNIPRVTRTIRLADYDPQYSEGEIAVWVNLPVGMARRYVDIQEAANREGADLDAVGADLVDWLREVWGWERSEVEELQAALLDQDLQLWRWLVRQTWLAIGLYRTEEKKS